MIFFNLFKQATTMAFAIVAFMAFAWLPLDAYGVTIGDCYQKPRVGNASPCAGDSKWGSGNGKGNDVIPYNCLAWKPRFHVNHICSDVNCQTCTPVNSNPGDCVFFTKQAPIRCIIQDN